MQKQRGSGKNFNECDRNERNAMLRVEVTDCVCFSSVKRQCEEKEQRLAVLEENFSSTQKEVTELRSCLREVERSRLEARRELQELRRQVRTCCHNPLHTSVTFRKTLYFTI